MIDKLSDDELEARKMKKNPTWPRVRATRDEKHLSDHHQNVINQNQNDHSCNLRLEIEFIHKNKDTN